MEKNIETELNDVVSQIKSAKCRGRKSIKVKVYQIKTRKEGHPTGLYIKSGMFEGGEGEKALMSLGYNISYEREKRNETVMTKNGAIPNGNVLHTTVMTVRW